MLQTIGFLAVGLWAVIGVPLGLKEYKRLKAEGVTGAPAVIKAVIHGISKPLAILTAGIMALFAQGLGN